MAGRILNPEELASANAEVQSFQRQMLEHVPAWLKYRGHRQRDLAEFLGTTEASVSKWISGKDAMKAGLLVRIATFLKAEPGDILEAPPGSGLTKPVADLLSAAEGLSKEEVEQITELARLLQRKRAP